MQNAFNFTSSAEDQDALRVLHVVRQRLGKENAISMHELERQLEIPARQIQMIVKLLVEERNFPVGTSTRRPYGYYWITSECERRECRNHLIRRALSTLRHAQAFDRDSIVAPLVGQLELTVGDES
jgi:hypothetical protein